MPMVAMKIESGQSSLSKVPDAAFIKFTTCHKNGVPGTRKSTTSFRHQVLLISPNFFGNSGLYYKCFMIIIYDRNDSGQYYKTTIMIVIYNPSFS
jgi:hypothetical protein